jgi:hypothetical protein
MSASGCECKRRRSRIGEQLGRVPSNTGTMTSCSLRRLQELADVATMSASDCEWKRRRSRIGEQLGRVPSNTARVGACLPSLFLA